MSSLLTYINADVNNLKAIENTPLRMKALPLSFPLTKEDRQDIQQLVQVLKCGDSNSKHKRVAGVAAPQIGISKRIIVFEIPTKADKFVDSEPYPKGLNIWINPTFEKVNNERDRNPEGCETLRNLTGPVRRYKTIRYKAYDTEGNLVEGESTGTTARVIQHEIDHLDGKLFIDRVPKGKLITVRDLLRNLDRWFENDSY